MKDQSFTRLARRRAELLRKLAEHNRGKADAQFCGLDVEPEMVKQARLHCSSVPNIKISQEDARVADMDKADLIVSYYTMQFVPRLIGRRCLTKYSIA